MWGLWSQIFRLLLVCSINPLNLLNKFCIFLKWSVPVLCYSYNYKISICSLTLSLLPQLKSIPHAIALENSLFPSFLYVLLMYFKFVMPLYRYSSIRDYVCQASDYFIACLWSFSKQAAFLSTRTGHSISADLDFTWSECTNIPHMLCWQEFNWMWLGGLFVLFCIFFFKCTIC